MTGFSAFTVPAIPEILSQSGGIVSWTIDVTLDVLSYDVAYEGGHCNSSNMHTTNNTFVAELELGLDKGSNYTLRVRAVNAFTSGEWSESIQLQTASTR